MTTTRRYRHYTASDLAELAAAEHPVMVQLVTGQPGRFTATGAATTGTLGTPAYVLGPAVVAAPAEQLLDVEVTVAAELARAAVRPLNRLVADPYQPARGESAVRLVGQLVGLGQRITARLEFSDSNKRGPERRTLAALLGRHYGVEFERVITWHERTIDTGHEYDEQGRFRGTSRREEYATHSYGRERTDARVWGTAEAVAHFVAVLPIVLEQIDRLSLQWGKQVAAWLAGPGEHWTTPRERRGTVTRARKDFAETVAFSLGLHGSPTGIGSEVNPAKSLPYQSREAAVATLHEAGWWQWLDQWQRPKTEAVYGSCAALAERLAAHLSEERAQAAAAVRRQEAEQRAAAEASAAAEIAAQDAAHRTETPTAEEIAQLEAAAAVEPVVVEEEQGYREAPHREPAPRVERVESADELRAQAAILVELRAPSAARILLDRAEELDRAAAEAVVVEEPAAVERTAVAEPAATVEEKPTSAAPAVVEPVRQPVPTRTVPVGVRPVPGPRQLTVTAAAVERFALTA